ncbi:uncharacterized protein LOC132947800 [Metopolophium dirhodum]|uniref:uncharacterized protein LOC132947800 n=1 Tax=Metopolophium dirhodum TaxID=44670 RepID=UPI00298FD18D|nr:uncharacterized protein LOC132947800 [Metopolophium dirhodum]
MLTKKWAYRDPVFLIGRRPVPLLKKVRYLGLHIDPHLTFSAHFRTVSAKALGGPSQSKRAMLMSVVNSRLLYASSTWAKRGTEYAIFRKLMIRPQRLAALKVTRTYHTVSAEAALFLTGTPLGDLFALERKGVQSKMDDSDILGSKGEIRKDQRDILLADWSSRWRHGKNAVGRVRSSQT